MLLCHVLMSMTTSRGGCGTRIQIIKPLSVPALHELRRNCQVRKREGIAVRWRRRYGRSQSLFFARLFCLGPAPWPYKVHTQFGNMGQIN